MYIPEFGQQLLRFGIIVTDLTQAIMKGFEQFRAECLELFQSALIPMRENTPDHTVDDLDLLLPGFTVSPFAQPGQVQHLLPALPEQTYHHIR